MIGAIILGVVFLFLYGFYSAGQETGREEFITQCQKDGGFTIQCESNNVKFWKKYSVAEVGIGSEMNL